jgi:hypothetical protein
MAVFFQLNGTAPDPGAAAAAAAAAAAYFSMICPLNLFNERLHSSRRHVLHRVPWARCALSVCACFACVHLVVLVRGAADVDDGLQRTIRHSAGACVFVRLHVCGVCGVCGVWIWCCWLSRPLSQSAQTCLDGTRVGLTLGCGGGGGGGGGVQRTSARR